MFRFFGLMWDARSRTRTLLAVKLARKLQDLSTQWRVEYGVPGAQVLVAGSDGSFQAHPLRAQAGVIIGDIYRRQCDVMDEKLCLPAMFDEEASRAVLATGGRSLLQRYWGNYVAILNDSHSQSRCVINDPCGPLPCYITEYEGVRVLFSCIEDCRELGLGKFDLNWDGVRRKVVEGIYDVASNPFHRVTMVHRGQCVRFDARGCEVGRAFYWHPSRVADQAGDIGEPLRAAAALRATMRSVVATLAAPHRSVLQQTSGGFDSSVVLGCLSAVPVRPRISCYTNYIPGAPSDERRWARLASSAASAEHVEKSVDPGAFDFGAMPTLTASVEPPVSLTHWLKGPFERGLAAAASATAVFTGEGGDAVFCATTYPLAVDHCLRRYGPGRAMFRTALAVAARRDLTVWRVLLNTARRQLPAGALREHRRRLASGLQLVTEEARASVKPDDPFPNPWFSDEGVPLQTLRRLGTLAFAPSFYDLSCAHHASAPRTLSPLCMQPVFEICQRIPIDIHFAGGRSRGLARRAFADVVPAPIIRRQWKDRPLSQPADIVRRNLGFIREALLDGELVKERILDRHALELALREAPSTSRATSGEILQHLDLALWVRRCL